MAWLIGGVVNDQIPDVSAHLEGLNIDATEFQTWLAGHVGNYRSWHDLLGQMPGVETEKKELSAFIKGLKSIINHTEMGGLPPTVEAHLSWEAHKAGFDWIQAQRDVYENAIRMLVLAEQTNQQIADMKASRGRKPDWRRDKLIDTVVSRLQDLGATAENARERAEVILIACKIEVPTGERSIRRAQGRTAGGH